MRKELLVTGTSFVPPISHLWNRIKEEYEVYFSSIGNTVEILDTPNLNKVIVSVFILSDFQSQTEQEYLKFTENFMSIMRQRLTLSNKPVLFCFSTRIPSDIISKSKVPETNLAVRQQAQKLCDEFQHFYAIDLDDLLGQQGYSSSFSYRNWYFSNTRLTNKAWDSLVQAISQILYRLSLPPKKVLVLDCDNTIWGGVIGEDGLGGVVLGQDGLGKAFRDFQSEVVKKSEKGTLICLVSKNNEEDVWSMFDEHSEMILRRKHVIASRINWNDKSTNLMQLAKELNVGLESFAFWDDNPFERDQVKRRLPEVSTIEPPEAVELWPLYLRELSIFSNFYVTEEDMHKQAQYRSALEFQRQKSELGNTEEYLKIINLSASLIPIDEQNITRAEQISLKTNQFNLRSIRHTAGDIREFISKEGNFGYLVKLNDVFGDHGLVALFLVRTKEGLAFVESFNISCRVFGRKLEHWISYQIERLCNNRGISSVVFEAIPTEKSHTILSKFLDSEIFTRLDKEQIAVQSLKKFLGTTININGAYLLQSGKSEKEIEEIYEK